MPVGKACFVRSWGIIPSSGAAEFATRYRIAGFSWAVVCSLWGEATGNRPSNREPAYYAALQARGVETWVCWILPKPGAWRDALGPWLDHAQAVGCRGAMIDPELEWKGDHAAEAREFMAAARAGCSARGLKLAVTSYAVPQGHGTFPWREFSVGADFGVPQVYDRDMDFSAEMFARAMRGWQEMGYRAVVPAGSLWNHRDDRSKTPAETVRHLMQVPKVGSALLWPTVPILPAVLAVLPGWTIGAAASGGLGLLGAALVALIAWRAVASVKYLGERGR